MGEMTAAVPTHQASSSVPLRGGLKQLVDADQALLDWACPSSLSSGDAGAAGDTVEDGAGQHGGDDLAGDLEHDVHAAALLDVLALDAVEPQYLRKALLDGLVTGAVGGAVVAAALGLARAAAHCADVLRLDHDLDGLQTVL